MTRRTPILRVPDAELPAWGAPEDENFWDKASTRPTRKRAGPDAPKPRRRILLWVGLSFAAILLLLIAFAPAIAARFVPGIIRDRAAASIAGEVRLDSASLSWFGAQSLTGLKLLHAGKPVADLSLELDHGLLRLVTGSRRLGTATLRGRIELVRFADGTTNLERALRPAATPPPTPAGSAPGEPLRVPDGAAVRLVIDSLAVNFRDESAPDGPVEVSLRRIEADADLAAGEPLTLKLRAETASRSGTIAFDARLDKWMGSDGALTPERITVKATLAVKDFPTAFLDAILDRAGALSDGLGERLHIDLVADGSLKSAQATLRARAGTPGAEPAAAADLAASLSDGVLSLTSPATLAVSGAALRALAPPIDRALAAQDALTLDALPDLRVTVSELRARVPREGTPLDLRQARLELEAATGAVAGRVRLDDAAPPRAMALAPLTLRLSAPDLNGPVRLALATSAKVADDAGTLASAGTIDADFTLTGLLDPAGAPIAGIPTGIEGRARVRGIATALAQPFVERLDLPRDVGPTIDIDLTATASSASASDLPPTDLTLTVAAEHVNALASLALRADRVATRGEGVRLSLRRTGAVAGRFLDPAVGLALDPVGTADFALTDLILPLSPARAPLLDQADARLEATITGLRFRASDAQDAPIRLASPLTFDSLRADALLARGRTPAVTLAARGVHDGQAFSIDARAEIAGLLTPTPPGGEPAPLDLAAASPVGALDVRDLPTALIQSVAMLATPAVPDPDSYRAGDAIDLPRLIRDTLGPTLNLAVTGRQSSDRVALEARIESRGLSVRIKGEADDRAISLEPSRTRLTLDPAVTRRLYATFAGPDAPRPALAEPTGAVIDLAALVIPRAAFDDPALLPPLSLSLGFDRHLIIHGLAAGQGPDRRELGPVGLAGFSLRSELPLAALAGQGAGTLKGLISGDAVFTGQARRLATFNGEWSLPLTAGPAMAGPLTARLNLVRLDTAAADAFLTTAGLLQPSDPRLGEVLGPTADGTIALAVEPPAGTRSLAEQLTAGRTRVEASLTAAQLSTLTPLRLALLPDRIALSEPFSVSATLTPAVAGNLLTLPEGTGFESPVRATVGVRRFVLARASPEAPDIGPLRPGVFDLDLQADLAPLQFNSAAHRMTLTGTRAQVTGAPAALALDIAEVVVHPSPGSPAQSARNMVLRATADNLADDRGNPTPDRVTFNANADLPLIPTALVDAPAGQGGLLVDALGPTVAVTLRAESLSPGAGTGTLVVEARSDHAVASIRGRMTPGLFLIDQAPAEVRVTRLTPDLSRRLTRGLPLLASLEKTPDMQPASLLARDFRVPTDGNLANLSGDAEIDPGVIRFATSPLFARVLARAHQRSEGAAGERLQPLRLQIRDGVIRLDRWQIPLGEFTVLTEGTVNLVAGDLDIITWIPLSALSEEAARAFRTTDLLAGVLGRSREEDEQRKREILAPFRSRGRMGQLGPPTPDPRLFAEEVGRTFKDQIRGAPRRVLEDLLRDRRSPP
jgi:hypothetical protein